MALIENVTPFASAMYRKMGYLMAEDQVLALRGTLHLPELGRPLHVAKKQRPLRWGETLSEPTTDMLRGVVCEDGDVVPAKRSTDIHVSGSLWSPTDHALEGWTATVRVGAVASSMRIHGPRQFQRTRTGWQLTKARPIEQVQLDYHQAFGGLWLPDDGPASADRTDYVSSDTNPAGCGWLPLEQDLAGLAKAQRQAITARIRAVRELPAPQFESTERSIHHPQDRHTAKGWGPIARWWSPRRQRQGSFDDIWRKYRAPEWPSDFDPAYFNSAHPDLTAPHWLAGDEDIALLNCTAQGERTVNGDRLWRTRLPGFAMYAYAQFASGRDQFTALHLSTVHIDLDASEVMLTWHACWPPDDEVSRVLIGGMSLADWRASPAARLRPYLSWNEQGAMTK